MSELQLWWSHAHGQYKRKRLNLKKIPEKYRCPTCGKILVKPRDREPMFMRDKRDWEIKYKKIKELIKVEQPTKVEWNDFCKRHNELFEQKLIPLPDLPIIELGFYGGVCQCCWLDGLGAYGKFGGFMGRMLKMER